tara:strand:+ start:1383 stop:1619 length:237 start_codon:yes stop_codon:yes gene_type:complete
LNNAKNKKRMENRKRIIELLTAVRYTTNDIEKVADEILDLFSVSQQRELLKGFANRFNESSETYILEGEINKFLKTFN